MSCCGHDLCSVRVLAMYVDVRCVPVACSVRDMNVDGMLLHRVLGVVVTL